MTALALILSLLMTLCACSAAPAASSAVSPSGSSSVSQPATEPDFPTTLQVGYGRADITPATKVPLAGYGNTSQRMSETTLAEDDRLLATCIALTDAAGETVLLFSADLIRIPNDWLDSLRTAIKDATGVDKERILLAATHTHSAPDVGKGIMKGSSYYKLFLQGLLDAATVAMGDRSGAKILTGSTQVENMSWIRHLTLSDGSIAGDNFGRWNQGLSITGYTTQADREMQLVRFVREGEGKKDILLANWQAHPKVSSNGSSAYGRAHRPYISADYVGTCRNYVEANTDCLFAYFLGGSGNMNPRSHIAADRAAANCPEDTLSYGNQLGGYVVRALDTLTAQEEGTLQTEQQIFAGRNPVNNLPSVNLEINALSLGGIGFVTVPYEMFDTLGTHIKENSPFDTTFVITCANGSNGYVPHAEVYDYEITAYEVTSAKVAKGTGEEVADTLLAMLKTQAAN